GGALGVRAPRRLAFLPAGSRSLCARARSLRLSLGRTDAHRMAAGAVRAGRGAVRPAPPRVVDAAPPRDRTADPRRARLQPRGPRPGAGKRAHPTDRRERRARVALRALGAVDGPRLSPTGPA